eukprot:5281802-Prymnesium_polylepis.1
MTGRYPPVAQGSGSSRFAKRVCVFPRHRRGVRASTPDGPICPCRPSLTNDLAEPCDRGVEAVSRRHRGQHRGHIETCIEACIEANIEAVLRLVGL